jgi:hypothetical protein
MLGAAIGGRRFRLVLVPFLGVALAFVLHALSKAPTNGVRLVNPGSILPQYLAVSATTGAGETVALAALGVALAGLLLSQISE